MKTATAKRVDLNLYRVRWWRWDREVPFHFLLALCAGGYVVKIDQGGFRLMGEPKRRTLKGFS